MSVSSAVPVAIPAVQARQRRQVALYLAAVFFFWMAQYIYAPTLPTYVESKTDDLVAVGVILSMYGLAQGVVRLPLGIAADRLGWHKPFILVGLTLSGVGAWILGTSATANGLLVGRSVTGLAAATWVPLVVAFSAFFPAQDAVRASALLTLANSLGRILATSLTGPLNQWGGYTLAFLVAVGVAAVSILAVLPVREVRRPPKPFSWASIGRLIARRDVLLPSLLSAVAQYAQFAITYSFMPVLVKAMGGSDLDQSVVMTLGIVMYTLGNLVATSLAHRVGGRQLVNASFIVICGGIGIGAIASSLFITLIAQLVIGFAMGVLYPVLMGLSIEKVADDERATAMGLHQAVYSSGMFAGPAVSGALAVALGLQPMFAVTAVACLVIGLAGTRLMSPQKAATD